ncbi:hypothetical protein DYB37_013908, partial [Aphanomyces astaci]
KKVLTSNCNEISANMNGGDIKLIKKLTVHFICTLCIPLSMRVISIIEYLQKQHAVDQINIAECLLTHGDTIDAILEESGCDGFKTLCNFTSAEFGILYGISWEMQATHFKFKAPMFQKLITLVIAVVESIFFRHFVKIPSMTDLRNKDAVFANYPCALYPTDVKF